MTKRVFISMISVSIFKISKNSSSPYALCFAMEAVMNVHLPFFLKILLSGQFDVFIWEVSRLLFLIVLEEGWACVQAGVSIFQSPISLDHIWSFFSSRFQFLEYLASLYSYSKLAVVYLAGCHSSNFTDENESWAAKSFEMSLFTRPSGDKVPLCAIFIRKDARIQQLEPFDLKLWQLALFYSAHLQNFQHFPPFLHRPIVAYAIRL